MRTFAFRPSVTRFSGPFKNTVRATHRSSAALEV